MFKDDLFADKTEENWEKHREQFDKIAKTIGLSSKEKVLLFHYSLCGDTLDFDLVENEMQYNVWHKLCSVFTDRYSNKSRKLEN